MSTPTLPHPPFYTIPNINNLRDAALHPLTTPSGPLRPGLLFRSADVSKLDTSGWQSLSSLGVAHVFDLRSAPEVAKGWAGITASEGSNGPDVPPDWIKSMEQAGVKRSWVPVFQESDYSPEGLARRYVKYMDEDVQGFVEAYRDILTSGSTAYATIFQYLANLDLDEEKKGALVHCTAGKDRTGIVLAILFDFLGVNRQDIADEYNRTELGLFHIREEIVARLLQGPAFRSYIAAQAKGQRLSSQELGKLVADQKNGVEETEVSPEMREVGRQAALRMIGAKKESMMMALEMVDKEFGGSERYMREKCGLSGEELERLRKNLVSGK